MNIFLRIITVFILIVFISCKEDRNQEYIEIPPEDLDAIFASTHQIPDADFLGDDACKKCHQKEYKDWEGSHHDKAMQLANRETILADFKGEKFTSQGVTSRFYSKGDDFFVNTEGPDGKYHDYKIVYTFGLTPLQQYIVEFPKGRFQCLRTAWDSVKNKWFDLYPDFKVVHSEWLHWSRGGLNWNTMCSDCHSTNVRKNYDPKTKGYDTKYALINVNCEACHGPGKDHVEKASQLGENYKASGAMHMTSKTNPKELVDQCARCHMRREQISEFFNFEGTMLDHYYPQLITDRLYYLDGQILDEDYVYGSFVQSKMYQNNVKCSDCHNSHSLELKFKGNDLCAQCHIPEKYNTPEHHFHDVDSESGQCINCHMPGRYYMGNDFRRDHSFRIPRPDLSLKYDTPNACVGCHKDKDNEWAWEAFKDQHGTPDYEHFSELLAPGLHGDPNGKEALLELMHDTLQPEIARASAVNGLQYYINANDLNNLMTFLEDSSPMVRGATLDVLGNINTTDYATYLLPLLKDGKRSVRVKAFYALGDLKENQIPAQYKEVYAKVKKEFFTYLYATADFVGGLAKKANYYLKKGDLPKAIDNYEKALEIDPLNNMVRTSLANLYYRNGALDKAENAFKTVIEQEPDYGPTYYSLALLLAEQGRTDEAVTQLEEAITYMPENMRVYYNLGLLYDKANERVKAKNTLLKGLKVSPTNEDLLYTLAFFYSKYGETQKAKEFGNQLVQLYPNNTNYKAFLQQLEGIN
ncbi:tetratricopeptide repeat protein [Maribacter polysiphoniae]|uniref:Tetratricopeptide repeat protein n=1 Tax=Maribacter polysiphoniae TaxID=429344 RepID=A0A316E667_9FLAO|nr:tetratricopeptide repeat protein [Maribacter polysiphoniae]MBD1260427.1 tetratricopeptide repeat protein [Maribacter polysiphoniae]PWK25891.1 Tfp pilus assembly protein PilF [Maribacter polysiphoniae]